MRTGPTGLPVLTAAGGGTRSSSRSAGDLQALHVFGQGIGRRGSATASSRSTYLETVSPPTMTGAARYWKDKQKRELNIGGLVLD